MSFSTEGQGDPTLPAVRIQEVSYTTAVTGWTTALSVSGEGILFDIHASSRSASWDKFRITIDGELSDAIRDAVGEDGSRYIPLWAKFSSSLLVETNRAGIPSIAGTTIRYGVA